MDQILQEALRLKATDIHLEPYANSIRLRYRVDGILETVPVPADMRHLHLAVVSRLKIMAGLNIAEKRLPHDGRIAIRHIPHFRQSPSPDPSRRIATRHAAIKFVVHP